MMTMILHIHPVPSACGPLTAGEGKSISSFVSVHVVIVVVVNSTAAAAALFRLKEMYFVTQWKLLFPAVLMFIPLKRDVFVFSPPSVL